jgi:hypothetical protein
MISGREKNTDEHSEVMLHYRVMANIFGVSLIMDDIRRKKIVENARKRT